MVINTFTAEGGFKGYHESLKGEPLASYYEMTDQILKYPRATTWILSKVKIYSYRLLKKLIQECL